MPVEITCKTDYPFNETIDMSVKPAKAAEFSLSFHIPGWCANSELRVNGSAVKVEQDAKGFARVRRIWKPGDTVQLHFPMAAVVKTGRDNSPYGPYTGEHKPTILKMPEKDSTQGAPYATVSYGPLFVFTGDSGTRRMRTRPTRPPVGNSHWMSRILALRWSVRAMPSSWNWPLDSQLKLKVNAVAVDWAPSLECPQASQSALRETEGIRTDHPHSLRLHQVSDLHVPRHRRKLMLWLIPTSPRTFPWLSASGILVVTNVLDVPVESRKVPSLFTRGAPDCNSVSFIGATFRRPFWRIEVGIDLSEKITLCCRPHHTCGSKVGCDEFKRGNRKEWSLFSLDTQRGRTILKSFCPLIFRA